VPVTVRPPPDAAPDFPPSRFHVDALHAGLRADVFLFGELPFLSRTRVKQKIQMGETRLNGKRSASSARLREGDEITLQWRGLPDREPAPSLEVVYEDEFVLAVNKPAGIASHPMGRIQSGTVIQFARQRDAEAIRARLLRGDSGFFPRLVNRLDVFTSGVVLIALTRETLISMQALLARGGVAKEYAALVDGIVAGEEGRIDIPLGADTASGVRVKMAPRAGGLPSVTEWRLRRRLPAHTLLSVFPLTGRQHQIRVHLAAIGHPVWGDLLYNNTRLFLRYQGNGGVLDDSLPPRQCLHAERVSFTHPVTGTGIAITAPIPADFLDIVARQE
jgi:23S rRNA pseudouridine1911/1915/1917 synthase